MKSQKQSAMTVLVVALAMLMAACSGSSDDSSAGGTSAEPTATSNESDDTAQTPSTDSGDPTNDEEDVAGVVEIPDSLKDQAAEALSVSKDSLEFNDPILFASSNCFLQTAWSNDSTAFGAQFAVLDNGDVLAPSDSSVATALESCFYGVGNDITADEWAELIVTVDRTPLLVRVMTENISFEAQNVGATWFAPVSESNGDTHTVRFLALGIDFGDVYEVTATRSADGTFSSQYDPVRAGS